LVFRLPYKKRIINVKFNKGMVGHIQISWVTDIATLKRDQI